MSLPRKRAFCIVTGGGGMSSTLAPHSPFSSDFPADSSHHHHLQTVKSFPFGAEDIIENEHCEEDDCAPIPICPQLEWAVGAVTLVDPKDIEFDLRRPLGKGHYGCVYNGKFRHKFST